MIITFQESFLSFILDFPFYLITFSRNNSVFPFGMYSRIFIVSSMQVIVICIFSDNLAFIYTDQILKINLLWLNIGRKTDEHTTLIKQAYPYEGPKENEIFQFIHTLG